MVGLATLAAITLLRIWIGVLGLAQLLGMPWALAVAAALILSGMLLPLRVAVAFGAASVWHWPVLLAIIVAAPRLILVLPGLISTFLAGRRHPRPRWSPYRPA
jgi:hypothetical protein